MRGLRVRAFWLINPATVTPFAAAVPAAAFLAIPNGPAWFFPMFGLCFILALAGTIMWLPIVGPLLQRVPGKRFAPAVLTLGCLVTALVFWGVALFLLATLPRLAPDVPFWLGSFRIAFSGAYFGIVATLCLYIDPRFRFSPGPD